MRQLLYVSFASILLTHRVPITLSCPYCGDWYQLVDAVILQMSLSNVPLVEGP